MVLCELLGAVAPCADNSEFGFVVKRVRVCCNGNVNSFWQTYRVPLVLGGLGVIVIVVSLALLFKAVQTTTPIEFSSSKEGEEGKEGQERKTSKISVDIEGAVASPGVYQLPAGSRVDDAIVAAGGLSADADIERIASSINRAGKLVDAGKLYFPKKGEAAGSSSSDVSNVSPLSNVVSINSGSQSELEALRGIGPATAQKIIDGRPYQTLEELVSKKAMGQSLFNKLKEQLTL